LSGSPAALAPTIGAAARADIARSELNRARPRFRARGARIMLSEWLLPKTLARAEQDLAAVGERYANELRRALIQKLNELPTAGFAELVATWLNTEGVIALRAVRRPGSTGSELHFAGTRKSGSEEVRLAIVVQRAGRDIDREAVIDVRGALHHYGQASTAWIVTTGRVTSGAREEAALPAAATALFDGMALASAMERLGIAVRRHVIPHHEIDYDLLEALGDTPEQRERREREQ
jgi:restriction endonuclease Mrr